MFQNVFGITILSDLVIITKIFLFSQKIWCTLSYELPISFWGMLCQH